MGRCSQPDTALIRDPRPPPRCSSPWSDVPDATVLIVPSSNCDCVREHHPTRTSRVAMGIDVRVSGGAQSGSEHRSTEASSAGACRRSASNAFQVTTSHRHQLVGRERHFRRSPKRCSTSSKVPHHSSTAPLRRFAGAIVPLAPLSAFIQIRCLNLTCGKTEAPAVEAV